MEAKVDDEPFEQKMKRLTKEIEDQFATGKILEQKIHNRLAKIQI